MVPFIQRLKTGSKELFLWGNYEDKEMVITKVKTVITSKKGNLK